MSAKPVMMTGVLYPMNKMAPPMPCAFVGNAWDPSLSVGGGPMPGGEGPGIWPSPGHPSHPIYWPPGIWPSPGVPTHPIYLPPGIWGGANEPFPTPPIVIPPAPVQPPTDPGTPKPPPPEGGWGWHPEYGWGYFPGGGGKPVPIAPGAAKK